MIRDKTARSLLYAWHGGGGSAFYQAASAGLVADSVKLRNEIETLCHHASNVHNTAKDRQELEKLKEWLEPWFSKPSDFVMDDISYIVLPWGPEQPV